MLRCCIMKKLWVALGDGIESSKNPDYAHEFYRVVGYTGNIFGSGLLTKPEITRGDEVAVISHNLMPLYEWITHIRNKELHKLSMRWSMVYGEVEEASLANRSAAEAVGPAFIAADKQMQALKKEEGFVRIASGKPEEDDGINALADLLWWEFVKMTSLQRNLYVSYRGNRNQKETGEQWGKSQQQVQQTLEALNWKVLDRAEKALLKMVESLDRKLS